MDKSLLLQCSPVQGFTLQMLDQSVINTLAYFERALFAFVKKFNSAGPGECTEEICFSDAYRLFEMQNDQLIGESELK